MILEKTTGTLRDAGERIFALIEGLTGIRPYVRESAWYRAETAQGRAFLFIRLVGIRAKRNPPNSIHFAARWDERLVGPAVVEGTNWFESQRSLDFVARADDPESMRLAEEFIRRAYEIRNSEREHLGRPELARAEPGVQPPATASQLT